MKAGNAAAVNALKALLKPDSSRGRRPHGAGRRRGDDEHRGRNRSHIERGYRADAAIVVEPSGPPYRLGIIPASPGVFYMEVTVKGKAAARVHAR